MKAIMTKDENVYTDLESLMEFAQIDGSDFEDWDKIRGKRLSPQEAISLLSELGLTGALEELASVGLATYLAQLAGYSTNISIERGEGLEN